MRPMLPIFTRKLSHICGLKHYKETKWFIPDGNPTGVYVYNCVANQNVPVILSDPYIATWYSCGPTVYDSAHIGHASCYVKLDIIQRILKSFFNIKLVTAMGITDIDDKIINKGNKSNKDFRAIAKQYEHEYWQDMNNLNVEKPLIICRVSENIKPIENFVQKLIDSEMAYMATDGSVYFDTSRYPSYGKLQKMQDIGDSLSSDKKNKMDFALWKGFKPDEPFWETSWGKGRPGWHIECSAMVSKVFGSQIDFHAGGIDLQFPHHENEEAQCCAFHNTRQWANYWIHVGHLHAKGDVKMSKSLQNTISIPDILESFSADTFRMACLMSNYRYTMEYNEQMMKTAEDVLNKIKYFIKDASVYVNNYSIDQCGSYNESLLASLQQVEESIIESLKSDFDTATCINTLLNLISTTNKVIKTNDEFFPIPVLLIAGYITNVLTKLGLKLEDASNSSLPSDVIDILVGFRRDVRTNALASKNKELLTACDTVRDKLKTHKVQINDSKSGNTWVYIK